jgi:hypothetical protein
VNDGFTTVTSQDKEGVNADEEAESNDDTCCAASAFIGNASEPVISAVGTSASYREVREDAWH